MLWRGICSILEYMPEVIPAILASDFSEVKEKIKLVEPYVKWVQLDVADGKFVPNTTWNNPDDLKGHAEEFGVSLEAHLMISEPENSIAEWINAGVNRIIFHIEAAKNPQTLISICKKGGVEAGAALNPETNVEQLKSTGGFDYGKWLDMILVMGVNPGFGGQEFKPEVIAKIHKLRGTYPGITIGVDGGMRPETAKKVVGAGANTIVAGSYIFGSDDVKKAIEELKRL